jgi:hypothetical protein
LKVFNNNAQYQGIIFNIIWQVLGGEGGCALVRMFDDQAIYAMQKQI